jgi:hypothetical protein
MKRRRSMKRAAIICLGTIVVLLFLGIAAFPRAESTLCRNASLEVDRLSMAQDGETLEAKMVP